MRRRKRGSCSKRYSNLSSSDSKPTYTSLFSERCGPGRRLRWSGPQFPRKDYGGSGHGVAAADIDAGGGEGAVRLLGGGGGRDGGTGFKLVPVGDLQTLNRHGRSNDELLLAVLVFHGEDWAVHTGDGLADRAIGHGAVGGARPPRPMSVAMAAHGLREDAQFHCLLSAVGLRTAAAGDIVARLDVGGRRLHPGDDQRIVGKLQRDRAAGRFDVQRTAL